MPKIEASVGGGFKWIREGWVITNKNNQDIPDRGVDEHGLVIVPVYCHKIDAEAEVRNLGKEKVCPCRVIIEVEGN